MRGFAVGVVLLAATNTGLAEAGAQEPSLLPPVPLGLELYMPVPEDSPITREGIELGRRLFFEPRLSVDGTISCASCHRPEHGFADTVPLSEGVGGRRPARHTPGLLNAGYSRSFFWDGRTERLEEQVVQPIVRPDEMGLELKTAVARLRADGEYRAAFAAAFREGLSQRTLARALASYVRSLRSGDSRVDRYVAGDTAALGPDEREGYRIFLGRGGCASCHGGPLFGDGRFHNTGVAWPPGRSAAARAPEDPGRFGVTGDSADLGAFSTPSLRDVARTAPYMHDGSLATLRDVVEFYDRGGRPNPHLDPEIRPLGLSDREKEHLVSFLRALNGRPSFARGVPQAHLSRGRLWSLPPLAARNGATSMPRRVLLVDDEPKVLESLSEALAAEGLEVLTAESAEKALSLVASRKPEVILSDVRMPGVSGLELLRLVKDRAPSVDVVVMTAYDDMATVVEAMREGASDFLTKPVDLQGLRSVVDRMFRDRRARREAVDGEREDRSRPPESGLGPLVGRDPKMIEVYKKVGQLAGTRVTVLITGETGTGKELVAHAIHDSSPWAEEPFVALNCTAIPEGLLESELFGHVRGAFTGAVNDRRGRFAMAGRGTLFLDEIGDTPLGFQAKLLRVLEERSYVPVGAESSQDSEARVIAATHHPLEDRIEAGDFRKDLYYRLRVVEIHLPPLRERRGDVPRLARHLIRRASRELERPAPTLSEATEDLLVEHAWPGNVRELENCLTRAVALATGHVIRPADLAFVGGGEIEAADYRSLDEKEQEHVQRILRATGGNKTRAAEILGVSRPRLYRLIEKHGLTAHPGTGRAD